MTAERLETDLERAWRSYKELRGYRREARHCVSKWLPRSYLARVSSLAGYTTELALLTGTAGSPGVTLVPEIPFESGQIVCQDSLDAKTLEVMSCAASFPDSLFGDALNPGTLNQELQTSQ
jgi:hypothetical protein